ncbi:MAG: hypothetical protein IJB34_01360 [Clostridia bacterium]|nr:hypothetical protein [Clostridia bacterium]
MKKKILASILAVATLSTCAFTAVACSEKDKTEQAGTSLTQTMTGGGMQISESQGNGIKLMSATLLATEYEDYGISPLAENAYTLTATITPSDAANHGVDWTLTWSNPSSSWASGKTVTDYVTVVASGSSSKIATVSCLQPFGTQIIITATSQDNPTVKATCSVDYAQKVTSAALNIGNINVNFGGSTEIKYEVCPTVNGAGGTINANVTTSSVYTIAEAFTKTVTFKQPSDTEQWFNMKDLYPTGIGFADSAVTNWHGKEYYFDYTHDMKNWVIMQRAGDVCFDDLTTSEIIEYMSNITCPNLCTVTLTLTGTHNTYTYSSQLVCTGYTNNTPVNALALDVNGYVF